jgi:hypothetical protein
MTRMIYIVMFLCVATEAFAAPALTMPDLQALAKQQSWSELLDQAQRVDPSARTTAWNQLVRSAGLNVITAIEKDSDSDWRAAERLVAVVPDIERKYTFLKADKPYVQAKAALITRAVEACARNDTFGCGSVIEALADGVDKFPAGTARSIAFMISEEKTPSDAIHFWALAAAEDVEACRDGRAERSVLGVLRGGKTGKPVADAQRAAASCYAVIETALVRELIDTDEKAKPQPAFLRNACSVLKTHGKLTVLKKKKCP